MPFDLPNELVLCIFSFFKPYDLGRAAQVSKQWYVLSQDERLWQRLLINDFHFSSKTAEVLKESLPQNNYKQTYRYCKEYQLNHYQNQALRELQTYGLTYAHLCGRDWFNTRKYIDILKCLFTQEHFTADTAMEVLNDLMYKKSFSSNRQSQLTSFKNNKTVTSIFSTDLLNEPITALYYLFNLDDCERISNQCCVL